jgi:hypothetical protein
MKSDGKVYGSNYKTYNKKAVKTPDELLPHKNL